jgi:hypothetical protein
MIVDADTVEACVFAADNERCEIRQGPTDRNSESDTDAPHLTTFLISYQYSVSTPAMSSGSALGWHLCATQIGFEPVALLARSPQFIVGKRATIVS